jgi:DNA-binding GntR family transcriptional regulator
LRNKPISSRNDSLSLTDCAYQKINKGIMTGDIPGETRLVAADLAREMKISVTPVREALLRLTLEGFVKPIPRFGYVVETMTETDVIALFEARIGVERLIASLAADKITAAEIAFLENNLQKMNETIQAGRLEDMIELDVTFHRSIAEATRNKTFFAVNELVIQQTYRFRHAFLQVKEIAENTRDRHITIIKALKEMDAEKVDKAMFRHLEEVKILVSAYLEQIRNHFKECKNMPITNLSLKGLLKPTPRTKRKR